MTTSDDKFSELHRKNMETAMRLAKASIDNTQRVIALQTALAKSLYDAGISTAKAQSKAKTPKEVLRLQTEYARETTQRVVDVAGELADIANAARSDFSQVLAEQLVSGKEDLTESLQSIMAKLPSRIPSLSMAIEQAMSAANAAFEQISKVSVAAMGRRRKPKETN